MEENKNEEEAKKVTENQEPVKDEVTNQKSNTENEKPEEKTNPEAEEEKKAEPKKEVNSKPENGYAYEQKKAEKEANNPKKKGSKLKIIIISAVVALIILAVIIYFAFFYRKTIDLSKYIEVSYYTYSSYYDNDKAYDGYATADVSFDEDKLKDLLGSQKKVDKFLDKTEVTVENDNDGNLSNGDELEIKVKVKSSWLDDNKYKLKSEKVSVKVEGLEEADVLDLFKDGEFEVEITGVSPNLKVEVNNNSSNEFIKKNVTYYADESYGLSNGDTVTITAYYDESKALEQGIVIAEDTYEYEIKDQAEYIDSIDKLDATTLDTLKATFVTNVTAQIASDGLYVISRNYEDVTSSLDAYTSTEPELVATYLLTRKGSSSSYWYDSNKVCSIYKVIYTVTATGVTHEWYYVATATDVAIKDGKLYNQDSIEYDVSDSWDNGKTQQEAYDDLIGSQKGSYVIEEVGNYAIIENR